MQGKLPFCWVHAGAAHFHEAALLEYGKNFAPKHVLLKIKALVGEARGGSAQEFVELLSRANFVLEDVSKNECRVKVVMKRLPLDFAKKHTDRRLYVSFRVPNGHHAVVSLCGVVGALICKNWWDSAHRLPVTESAINYVAYFDITSLEEKKNGSWVAQSRSHALAFETESISSWGVRFLSWVAQPEKMGLLEQASVVAVKQTDDSKVVADDSKVVAVKQTDDSKVAVKPTDDSKR